MKAGCDAQGFVAQLDPPERVERPAGLHGGGGGRAGAHQHGAVDVGCNHQDAEQNRPDDGALQTQVIRTACHGQARQVRVTPPGMERRGSRSYLQARWRPFSRLFEQAYPEMSE